MGSFGEGGGGNVKVSDDVQEQQNAQIHSAVPSTITPKGKTPNGWAGLTYPVLCALVFSASAEINCTGSIICELGVLGKCQQKFDCGFFCCGTYKSTPQVARKLKCIAQNNVHDRWRFIFRCKSIVYSHLSLGRIRTYIAGEPDDIVPPPPRSLTSATAKIYIAPKIPLVFSIANSRGGRFFVSVCDVDARTQNTHTHTSRVVVLSLCVCIGAQADI